MNRLRVMRLASVAAAGLFGLLAYGPGGASAAGSASSASLQFTGAASAAAVEYSIDSQPPPLVIAGLFDVRTPTGVSNLSSSGISQATASVVTPGNAASGIALFCTAVQQTQSFCAGVNSATSNTPLGDFPPAYPLAASSSYPEDNGKPVTARAAGQPIGQEVGKGTPADIAAGNAQATTTASMADTQANDNSNSLAAGTPLAVSSGASSADTHQESGKNGFTVTGSTTIHDVTIAGLVRIDSVTSTATATNDGHGHITKNGEITVSGVTAMGHPATINQDGVSINGGGSNDLIQKTLNNALQKALGKSGVSIKLVPGQVKQTKREVKVDSGSLEIAFQHTVSGLPNPAQYLPCIPPGSCVVSAPNPNAYYFGLAILGGVDIDNYAEPGISTPAVSNVTPPASTPATKGSTKFIAGHPGTPGSAGSTGSTGTTGSPQVAGSPNGSGSPGGAITAGNVLSGTASRLKYIFPALFLAALAAFGGGLLRHPGRIPRPVDR